MSNSIPRTIWALWLQGRGSAPPLVRACLKSWEQMNPGWDFRLLERADIEERLDIDGLTGGSVSEMSPQHLSDLARINLLQRHGGVWVDATCLSMVPLDDWIHEYARGGFFAFSRPGRDRLISNWFLAASEKCSLVSRLCNVVNSYCAANNFTGPSNRLQWYLVAFARRLTGDNPWLSALYASPLFARLVGYTPYFWFHYAFAHTLLTSSAAREVWRATPKVSSDFSSGDGPHAVQQHGMFEDISGSLAARISDRKDTMYKLSWKKCAEQDFDLSEAHPRCAVKYAMQATGIQFS